MTDNAQSLASGAPHDTISFARRSSREAVSLSLLLFLHIAVCCLSLLFVAYRNSYPQNPFAVYVPYNIGQIPGAMLLIAAFGVISSIFVRRKFSFGYFVGFYLYTMMLGYVWLSAFSLLHYNHSLAVISAFGSAIAFLIPATMTPQPASGRHELTSRQFEVFLNLVLCGALVILLVGAKYNYTIIALDRIYEFRGKNDSPTILRYATSIVLSVLLPYAFAAFALRSHYWKACFSLVLLLAFYPITLTKLDFFAPFWLLFVAAISRACDARTSVLISLLAPIAAGLLSLTLFGTLFDIVNFRMVAIPSLAMDVYHEFFSSHPLTYFCQVRVLKTISCPYKEQLGIVMQEMYGLGNFNASLFATEGVASVGATFAPLLAWVSGLIIALGNRASSGLPARFVLLSSATFPQLFLNVPLTTTLVTHGALLLFLLWYVTPRSLLLETKA
ncbi:hypothetical protein [Bradyrhizobium sp. ORS 111]|uniref:hypothetical protein n=1 Tax=Bradyrhizobium sp. ORS 111 TaxID=1685958 RepID=UPI00389032DF